MRADADEIGDWEKWKIVPRGDLFVALQSAHGKYLVCDDLFNCGNTVLADRDHIKEIIAALEAAGYKASEQLADG